MRQILARPAYGSARATWGSKRVRVRVSDDGGHSWQYVGCQLARFNLSWLLQENSADEE